MKNTEIKIQSKMRELERKGFISIAISDKNNCLVCTGCSSCSDGGGGGG